VIDSDSRNTRTVIRRAASYRVLILSIVLMMATALGCAPPADGATAPTASSVTRPMDAEVTPAPSADPTLTSAAAPTETQSLSIEEPPTQISFPSSAAMSTSDGRAYYLDSVEGADSNSGLSPEEAWQTFEPLMDLELTPGDIVHFKKGSIWTDALTIQDHGSRTHPLTFTTYGAGKKPIFENPRGRSAITIRGNWVILEGMLVRNVLEAGVTIAADHTIVQNMEVTDAGMGVAVRGQYNIVRNNYIYDLKMVRNTPGGDDDYGAVGVWLFDSYNEVAGNLIVNCRAPSYDYGTDGGGVEIFGESVDGAYIHRNWIIDSDGGLEIGGGSARDHVIAYNVFINNSWAIVFHLGGRYASDVENIRFEHNVVIETAPHDRPLLNFFRGEPSETTLSVSNNIFYVLTGSVADHDAFQRQNNLYYLGDSARLGFRLATGELVAHPRFVDLDRHDFRLLEGSPAINAGIDLGYEIDFTGRPVPHGPAPDLGAFEHSPEALTEEAYKPSYPVSQPP
jgi:hypothetical protein